MSLPGLQRFQSGIPNEKRLFHIYNVQRQAIQRAVLNADSELRLYEVCDLRVGDTVVYYLQQHERKSEALAEGLGLTKYSPSWSLPTTILSLEATAAIVDLGNGHTTTVPRRLLPKLGDDVLPSLQPLLVSAIDKHPARLRTKPTREIDEGRSKKTKTEENSKK